MAFVFALDPTQPENTDFVADGAGDIRLVKDALIERIESFFEDVENDPWQVAAGATFLGGFTQNTGTAALQAVTAAGLISANLGLTVANAQSLTLTGATVVGAPTWDSTQTLNTSGNAGSATVLATPRDINGVAFDGSAPITVTAAAGTLTGATLAAGVTASLLESVGVLTAGTWSADAIAATKGGTGLTTYSTGDILYASAPNVLSKLAAAADGQLLMLAGGIPSWTGVGGAVNFSQVYQSKGNTGPIANGGGFADISVPLNQASLLFLKAISPGGVETEGILCFVVNDSDAGGSILAPLADTVPALSIDVANGAANTIRITNNGAISDIDFNWAFICVADAGTA